MILYIFVLYRSGSSEPNLDDFELISEEELEKESQNEFLGMFSNTSGHKKWNLLNE